MNAEHERLQMPKCHSFTLILAGIPEITDAIANKLVEAGCDDGMLYARDGVVYMAFDRTAESRDEAIESAVRDVSNCGVTIIRVEVPEEDEG